MTEETGGHVISWDVNRQAIAEVAEDLKDIDAYVDLPAAKAAKKTLTKMRTALGEAHKETKAEALAFGRKVDAKKNEYLALIKKIEDPISDQLDEIKNAEALAEQSRVDAIMAHIERLQAYAMDRHSLTLAEMEERRANLALEHIDPEIYQEMEEDAKLSRDEADLKLRLAIDREKTRLDEEADKARIEAENQELRDQLAMQAELQAERDAAARKIVDEELERDRLARKKADDERQAELDAQQATIDAEKKRIRDENEAQAEADNKAKADAAAAELAALQAPDLVKLETYAAAIDHLIGLKPVMGSNTGNAVLMDAVSQLIETHNLLTLHIEEMK